jgi:lysophospholipase L1-like esterase
MIRSDVRPGSALFSLAVSPIKFFTLVALTAVALPASLQAQTVAPNPTSGASARDSVDKSIRSITSNAVKSVTDVLSQLPCSAPKNLAHLDGALNRTARDIALNEPLTIVALGSSSTAGAGASSPAASYPARLQIELKRRFPKSDIKVINQGVNGEEAPDELARLDAVIEQKPDLVIWQLGTNAVLRDMDTQSISSMAQQGLARLKAAGIDVVMIDPQFTPKVVAKSAARDMVTMISTIGHRAHIPVFQRFAVMQSWHDSQSLDFDRFTVADGLHMNDWGYACFAHVLSDSLADSLVSANTVATASH